MQKTSLLLLITLSISIYVANADQNIEIVGGNAAGLPKIAIVKFNNDESGNNNLTDVIANDLSITGEFNVKTYDKSNQIESSIQYIISGKITNTGLTYQLRNNLLESAPALINQSITINQQNIRKTGHTSSNMIYKKITNTEGIFTSKIAYIMRNKNLYQIIVSDYDGFNQTVILSSHYPLSSLAWDATGQQLTYVSFESNKPVAYVQDLYKVSRYIVANFSGSNSSPAFLTPNNKQMAVTLTKDDGSHIYLIKNAPYTKNSPVANLITYGTIDTETSMDKNGNIVFTSNHDGGPQVFMTNMKGATPTRLTMNLGPYNTTPRLSHDSSKITFINRNSGVLKTFVMDLATKSTYPVSQFTSLDMSPSFSPNDKLIIFSSNGFMYLVNITGITQTRLKKINGEIIDQRWANNA